MTEKIKNRYIYIDDKCLWYALSALQLFKWYEKLDGCYKKIALAPANVIGSFFYNHFESRGSVILLNRSVQRGNTDNIYGYDSDAAKNVDCVFIVSPRYGDEIKLLLTERKTEGEYLDAFSFSKRIPVALFFQCLLEIEKENEFFKRYLTHVGFKIENISIWINSYRFLEGVNEPIVAVFDIKMAKYGDVLCFVDDAGKMQKKDYYASIRGSLSSKVTGFSLIDSAGRVRSLSDSELLTGSLQYITLYPTRECDLACEQCAGIQYYKQLADWDEHKKNITLESLDKWFPEEQISSVKIITLSERYGEIFIYPYLNELFRYFEKVNPVIQFNILTHLSVDSDQLIRLIENHGDSINEIRFSIDGSTKETYEKIRRKASFTKVMKNLKILGDYKEKYQFNLEWKFVHMRSNMDEMPTAAKMAIDSKVDRFNVHPMLIGKPSSLSEIVNLSPDKANGSVIDTKFVLEGSDVEYYGPEALYGNMYYSDEEQIRDIASQPCFYPFQNMEVDAGGEVTACCVVDTASQLFMGNMNDGWKNVWLGKKYTEFRLTMLGGETPAPCRLCVSAKEKVNQKALLNNFYVRTYSVMRGYSKMWWSRYLAISGSGDR